MNVARELIGNIPNLASAMISFSTLDRIVAAASRPVDGSSAAVFRMVFGGLSFIAVVRFFTNGWVDALYVEPQHHMKYLGFGWVEPCPAWGMDIHFVVLGVLALFIAAGFLYRASIVLFLFGFLYIELLDAITYLNHYYWLSLTSGLMIFMPLHRKWSIDAWLRPSLRSDSVPSWVIWFLRGQLGAVYFFGGIAKLNPDWLFEALPMKIWLFQHGDFPVVGRLLQQTWLAYAMSWAGAAHDLTIVGWLLWRRTRPFAYFVIIGFHLTTWQLFPSLGMFPWLMMGSMLIFFSPDWPRTVAQWLGARLNLNLAPAAPAIQFEKSNAPRQWLGRLAVIAVAFFALAQILLPFRHLAYPGNVRWNEEGYRFAWRMMLSEKIGFVTYRVVDNSNGRAWLVEPSDYLTPLQMERMSINPDMIHQTALIIESDYRDRGYDDVRVYADAFVAFNGRANARIIDPNVDLTSVERGLQPKSWILPVPSVQTQRRLPAVAVGIRESDGDAE